MVVESLSRMKNSDEIDHLKIVSLGYNFGSVISKASNLDIGPRFMKLFMESNQKNDVRRAIRLFFYSNRHRKSYLL